MPTRALEGIDTMKGRHAVSTPALTRIASLAAPVVAAPSGSEPAEWKQACAAFLACLARWGVFERLPVDASGTLQFSLPFCGQFQEATLLIPFVAAQVFGRGTASSMSVFGCDLYDSPFWWNKWKTWCSTTFGPRLKADFRQLDLSCESLPPATLIFGGHPEMVGMSTGGVWPGIITNVIRSLVKGGRAVFATYYPHEAHGVESVCKARQVDSCLIQENPFYAGRPNGSGTAYRFAVIVQR